MPTADKNHDTGFTQFRVEPSHFTCMSVCTWIMKIGCTTVRALQEYIQTVVCDRFSYQSGQLQQNRAHEDGIKLCRRGKSGRTSFKQTHYAKYECEPKKGSFRKKCLKTPRCFKIWKSGRARHPPLARRYNFDLFYAVKFQKCVHVTKQGRLPSLALCARSTHFTHQIIGLLGHIIVRRPPLYA